MNSTLNKEKSGQKVTNQGHSPRSKKNHAGHQQRKHKMQSGDLPGEANLTHTAKQAINSSFRSEQICKPGVIKTESCQKQKRLTLIRHAAAVPSSHLQSNKRDEDSNPEEFNPSHETLKASTHAIKARSPKAKSERQTRKRKANRIKQLQNNSKRQSIHDSQSSSPKSTTRKADSRHHQKQTIKRSYGKAHQRTINTGKEKTGQKIKQGIQQIITKVFKRVRSKASLYASIALVLALVLGSLVSFVFSSATLMGGSILGGLWESMRGSEGMVEVARSQLGQVGGEPYWSWYGFPHRVEWCAIFVSWVAHQNGLIDEGRFPKFAGCSIGEAWFRDQNAWEGPGYCPSPGEIIFYDWNSDNIPDHVGIVESCDGSTVYTIEGNWGDSVHIDSWPVTSPEIYGYGTPNYFD